MATKIRMSVLVEVSINKRRDAADNFRSVSRVGMFSGNAKIVSNVALLLAFADIPEMKVKTIENPTLLNMIAEMKPPKSFTGLPTKKANTT